MSTRARLAACFLAAGLVTPALASPEQESERRALRRVAKAFQKLRSYRVDVEVEGGKARGPEHRIYEQTVNESYRAEVLGKLCRVSAPNAFRLRVDSLKGGVQEGGRWMAMLASDDGRLLARLFEAPEKHLAEALRFKRTARWVPPEDEPESGSGPVVAFDDEDERSGGTEERDDGPSSGRADEAPLSHHLRVVGPVEVALEHFITITNSGCFSEG